MASNSHAEAVARYNAKSYKRRRLAVSPELDERLRAHIAESGESLNGFIMAAISAALDAAEASAGSAVGDELTQDGGSAFPRTRGDDPSTYPPRFCMASFSPHTRG